MNLTQYLNQPDPQRLNAGEVILKGNEYKLGHSIVINQVKLTQVFINPFVIPIDSVAVIAGAEYVIKDGEGVLWTTDHHGNPKDRSCFSIKNKI